MTQPMIPAGAFAAMKAGTPQPGATPEAAPAPKTIVRKPEPTPEPPPAAEAEREAPEGMTAAEKKIWKLKADGEEFEFDATDEKSVMREIEKARGASKRLQSAAEMRKQAETFYQMLKEPATLRKVLEDPRIGVDVSKWAKEIIWEQMQEESMTPEQKTQRDRDREYEQLKADRDKSERTKLENEKKERQQVWEKDYEKKIMTALDLKGIPKDHQTVMKMAGYLENAIEQGIDLSPEDIADLVKADTGSYLKSYADSLTEEQFLEFLGEQNAEKLRKADLKRLRSTQSNPFPERTRPKPDAKVTSPKKMGGGEWKEALNKEFLARKR